jgi:hypothetical protein
LVISEDTGSRRTRRYLQRLLRGGGFDPHGLPFFINAQPKGLRFTDDRGAAIVRERVVRYDVRLLVLDCCEALLPSKDWKPSEYDVLRALATWCRERGVAVIMIDHTNKGKSASGGKPKPGLDRVFGASAKTQLTDYAVEFNGNINKGGVTATYVKQRDEPPPNYAVTLSMKGRDAIAFEIEADVRLDSLTDEEREIFAWLDREKGVPRSVVEIVEATEIPKRRVQRALRDLVVKGVVVRTEAGGVGKGRSVRYHTPPEPDVLGAVKNGRAA